MWSRLEKVLYIHSRVHMYCAYNASVLYNKKPKCRDVWCMMCVQSQYSSKDITAGALLRTDQRGPPSSDTNHLEGNSQKQQHQRKVCKGIGAGPTAGCVAAWRWRGSRESCKCERLRFQMVTKLYVIPSLSFGIVFFSHRLRRVKEGC